MENFLGEIRLFPYGLVPQGWHPCDGTILQVAQYRELFSLIGDKYGGDGTTTFALPDLRGRALLGQGSYIEAPPPLAIYYPRGQAAGAESVALTSAQVPAHQHGMCAVTDAASVTSPVGALPAAVASPNVYAGTQNLQGNMAEDALAAHFGDQAHDNVQPSLVLNYFISTEGICPLKP